MANLIFTAFSVASLAALIGSAAIAALPGHPAEIDRSLDALNLPGDFLERMTDRAIIDEYQIRHHRVEAAERPLPRTLFAARASARRFIRVVHSQSGPRMVEYCSNLPDSFTPLAGYRAPILEYGEVLWPARALYGGMNKKQIAAAELVARRLAHDGLLSTLVRVMGILGPERFATADAAAIETLKTVGLPTDLFACYVTMNHEPSGIVSLIAQRLDGGIPIASLLQELEKLPFQFNQTRPSFHVATESGEEELGMMRVQVGGGYEDGIVPGGSIDVISQLVRAFPAADFLMSVPNEYQAPFLQMASQTWHLRRTNQVTLVSEPLPVAAWAQDNGKAGWVEAESEFPPPSATRRLATLAPRYASIDEGLSRFQKGESFLMEGLRAAGHEVAQSPLLFQGGNLMAVRVPKSGERILLVEEAELHRNMALGLGRGQVLKAFQVEFGVDRCVVIPAVSFHLDFDVSLRSHNGELIAFVNDTMTAARFIVDLGVNALVRAGVLDTNAGLTARAHLTAGRDSQLVRLLRTAIPPSAPAANGYPSALSQSFAATQVDSTAGNLQCFLLALDLMESSLENIGETIVSGDAGHASYLGALRRMNTARQRQAEVFKNQGWKVVAVPSMGDLYRGINYLNGIHHRDGYVLPTFGGFFARLDNAAIAAFRQALGADFKITSILAAESQRHHGGVHCTTSAYPKL